MLGSIGIKMVTGQNLNEQIAIDRNLSAGNNGLSVTVPDAAPHGATYARFRFSTTPGLL